ncbi:hypothetical protein COE15_20755 [Bacillus cereus]|nr:hypothetical protein COE15_20755 [Bacillus cereus]
MGDHYNKYCKHYKNKYDDHCKDKYDDYYDDKYYKNECDDHSIKINVNCCDHKKDENKKNVRASAFRAVNNAPQNIAANTRTKVLFQAEQFDLAGEYNPNTSTFTPSKNGVYNITATVTFDTQQVDRSAFVGIRVNGVIVAAGDNDFFGPLTGFTNIVTATTILRLNAGDQVDVIALSSVAGTISVNNPALLNYTHFEAARFPS